MFDGRRPLGRFFCWIVGCILLAVTAGQVQAGQASTTRITDTVYRADGTPAKGSVVIAWGAFTAASGEAVAAGRLSIALGAGGLLDIALVPNTGSSPASHYEAVLKLDDGSTGTETWVVPATTTATLSAVRSKVVPASVAIQSVGRDYVDTALAKKASDGEVVHTSRAETISGTKTFLNPPLVPVPSLDGDAANKGYVDQSVQAIRAGSESVLLNPGATQTVSQPSGTSLKVNRADLASVNGVRFADQFASVQAALDDAGVDGGVVIPPGEDMAPTFRNPQQRPVMDLRRMGDVRGGMISVRDFGAEGGGGSYPYCSMVSGSTMINCTTFSAFPQPPHVGMEFRMSGAGEAGDDLVTKITAVGASSVTVATPASTTVSSRGGIWGWKTDNSPALQAAVDYCGSAGGCTLLVPKDYYGMAGTVTLPARNGWRQGRITIECMGGREATWFAWAGADQEEMFKAPADSVPFAMRGCGLTSMDSAQNARLAIGLAWYGGTEHEAYDNFFQSLYEGIRAYDTWLNKIEFNRFYGPQNAAVHFGPAGLGPVNATWVEHNEFGYYGLYGLWNDSNQSGGSQQNVYAFNSFEGTSAKTINDIRLGDTESYFGRSYFETAGSTDPNYVGIWFSGDRNDISLGESTCVKITGSHNIVRSNNGVVGYCPAPNVTKNLIDSGLYNRYEGYSASMCMGCTGAVFLDGVAQTFGSYGFNIWNGGTTNPENNWNYGRVDIAQVPWTSSMSTQANPNAPYSFATTATIPRGTIVVNQYTALNGAASVDSNLFWLCTANPCSSNPIHASEWGRVGPLSSKSWMENTAAPTSGSWTAGDFVRNSNPSSNKIFGWLCTAAGSPGVWMPVSAVDAENLGNIGAGTITASGAYSGTTATFSGTVNAAGYKQGGVTVTTPVYSAAGALQGAAHSVIGSAVLTSASPSTATVALAGAAAFTTNESYKCALSDETSGGNLLRVGYSSGTQFVITGPNTVSDKVSYVCVGN